MFPRFLRSAAGFLALALVSSLPAACAPLSDAMRQADPRLQKRVTLVASHILIGELLEKLSAQSGVTLTVGEKDGAGDPEVLVSLKDVKLADAMDALYSLASYQKAEWEWEKTGEGADAKYRLAQPPAARELSATLQKQIMADVVAQGKKLAEAVKKTPEELKEAAKTDVLLRSVDADYRVRTATAFFFELPTDVQNRVLQKGEVIQIPAAELSPGGKAYVAQEMAWQHEHNPNAVHRVNGRNVAGEYPEFVTARLSRSPGDLAPGIFIECGFGGGDLFGGGYLQKEWRGKLQSSWLLPGDAPTDDAESRRVAAPKGDAPIFDKNHEFHNHYLQLSEAANVPIIARLFNEDGSSSSAARVPYGLKLTDFLTGEMGDNGSYNDMGLTHKWRGGVLLVTNDGWIMDDNAETRVPWAIVKRLRDAESNIPDHFLPLSEMISAARVLTRPQMRKLGDHFPVMANVSQFYDLFSLMANSSSLPDALLAPQGTSRGDALTALGSDIGEGRKVENGTAKRVRMTVKDELAETPPMRSVMFYLVSDDGRNVAGQGFSYPKNQFVTQGAK